MDPHRKSVQNAGGFASGARTATPLVVGIPPWGISIFKAYLLVVIPGRGLFIPPKKTPKMGSKPISWLSSLAGAPFHPKRPLNCTFGPTLGALWAVLGSFFDSFGVTLGSLWSLWGALGCLGTPDNI